MTSTRVRPTTTTAATTAAPGPATLGVPAISLREVSKDFGPLRAVDSITLDVAPGEVVAFLGPNGAGKTTTIDMVLGLTQPSEGEVRVFGLEPRDAIVHGVVSAVMQTGGLLRDVTVRQTVDFIAALFPVHRRVDEVLDRAGITAIADRRVGACSGGEQQRLRFALALVSDPHLVILDEPTTGMDVSARRDFWQTIRADADAGRTVMFATHYLEEADAYADRIVLVAQGRVVADGTPAKIRARGAGRTVRATWPGVTADQASGVPGVESFELRGDTIHLHAADSDAVARHLLSGTPARDLEITARGLEDAFVALTSTHTADKGAQR